MTLREFYDLLKKHDWYYDMSEDPKVVLTGRINRQKLIKLSRQSPEHEKLFEEYRAKAGNRLIAWSLAILVSFVVRHSSTIQVDRDETRSRVNRLAVKEALDLLRKKQTIGVFGEGGTNRRGKVHPIFVNLARKSGARIIPVKLSRREVIFGEAISLVGDSRDSELIAREVMNEIHNLT